MTSSASPDLSAVTVETAFALALDYHREGRLEEARDLYRRILAVQPELWQAAANLARIAETTLAEAVRHHQAGRLGEAGDGYRRVLEDQPDNADALHLLGLVEWRTGDGVRGLARMTRALALRPDHPVAAGNLERAVTELFATAVERQRQGFRPDAEALYRCILAFRPDLFQAHANLASLLGQEGRLAEATAAGRRALVLDPGHADLLWGLAAWLSGIGAWAEAAGVYRRLLERRPDHSLAPLRLRVAEREARGPQDGDVGPERSGILALRLESFLDWEAAADLTVRRPADPAGETLPATHDYEVVRHGAWTTRPRTTTRPDHHADRVLALRGGAILHAGSYAGGRPQWHATIVRRGGTGSNSGTLPEVMNALFPSVFIDRGSQRVFVDTDGAERIADDGGGPVFYLENFQNYGHWMLDHLPRLEMLERTGMLDGCRIFSPWLRSWQIQTLRDLGLEGRLITMRPDERTANYLQVREIDEMVLCTFPPMARRVGFIRRSFLPTAEAWSSPERIFISRRNRENTRMRNEGRVADLLEAHGFAIIAPEELPFHRQVHLFANARVVVSATGSAYTNLVFAGPGTTYVELTGDRLFDVMRDEFTHYDMFPQLGVRHIVMVFDNLDRKGLDFFPVESAFEVDLDALERVVRSL